MLIEKNDIVLFQGDSITDMGRDRNDITCLGHGYAMIAASIYLSLFPENNVTFINKGIGGDRAINLKNRWSEDCLDLKPTVVSLMVGINDCWRNFDNDDQTSIEDFESNCHYLLEKVKQELNAKLILCEPFVLPFPEDRVKWRIDLDPKINIIRKLAREYKALLVPFDGILNSVSAIQPPQFWTTDGVHPTTAGHGLMAREWLKVAGINIK
jgi:acyl-CoA thioesterase I